MNLRTHLGILVWFFLYSILLHGGTPFISSRMGLSAEDIKIKFPSHKFIFLSRSTTGWNYGVGDTGLDDKEEQRTVLGNTQSIRSVSQFFEGPIQTQNEWFNLPILINGKNDLKNTSTWLALFTEDLNPDNQIENKMILLRRTAWTESPFVAITLPWGGSQPALISSSALNVNPGTLNKDGLYFFLSIAMRDHSQKTYVVRAHDGATLELSPHYYNLENDSGSKLFSLVDSKIVLTGTNESVSLKAFEGAPTYPIRTMNPITPSIESLPLSAQANTSNPSSEHLIEYAGESYRLHSLNPSAEQEGGTYITRSRDQLTVTLSPKAHVLTPQTTSVEGGILKFSLTTAEELRPIDLDNFDLEPLFVPTITNLEDFKWVVNHFPEFSIPPEENIPILPNREETVKSILRNLKTGKRTSTILTGDAGDRISIIIESLKHLPRTWSILTLGAGELGSNISYSGEKQEKVRLIKNALRTRPIVWIAEDIETLVGIGGTNQDPSDMLTLLTSDINSGLLRMIGTGSDSVFDRITDPSLQRALNLVPMDRLKSEEVLAYLHLWWKQQFNTNTNSSHQVPEALLKYIMKTAENLSVTESEPTRSIRLLEWYLSSFKEQKNSSMEIFDHIAQGNSSVLQTEILKINEAARTLYRVDPALMDLAVMRVRISGLVSNLRTKIIGHEHVIEALYDKTLAGFAGLHNGRGPRLSVYLDGPPGTGKTELAKAYADALGLPYLRIEMNQFQGQNSDADKLLRQIANQLKKNPFTVFNLDEVEKAHYGTLESLLALFDSPIFNYYEDMGGGRKRALPASAKHSTFFLTANTNGEAISTFFNSLSEKQKNLSADKIATLFFKDATAGLSREEFEEYIAKKIPRPLLDRVQIKTAVFPPTVYGLRSILRMNLQLMAKNLQESKDILFKLEGAEVLIRYYAAKARAEHWSTRSTIENLLNHVGRPVSEKIVFSDMTQTKEIAIPLLKPRTCSESLKPANRPVHWNLPKE